MPALDDPKLGERLRAAREASQKTQKEMSDALGVARTTVVAIENGTRKIRSEELLAWARLLGVSVNELLHGEQVVDFGLQFRRQAAATPSGKLKEGEEAERMLSRLAAAYLRVEGLLGRPLRYDYPPAWPIPTSGVVQYAEDLATELRGRLGLGLRPIGDLINLAETELTIRVFERPLSSRIAGAFAYSNDTGACILLNLNHPRPRRIWTLAHEIGHFMTTRDVADVEFTDDDIAGSDRFADAFAGAFLIPAAAVRRRFDDVVRESSRFTARDLVYLSRVFSVSVAALGRRLERLELLPKGTFEDLRHRGFQPTKMLPQEPEERPAPAPARFNLLIAEAVADGVLSEGQASRMLMLDRVEVRQIIDELGDQEPLFAAHGE